MYIIVAYCMLFKGNLSKNNQFYKYPKSFHLFLPLRIHSLNVVVIYRMIEYVVLISSILLVCYLYQTDYYTVTYKKKKKNLLSHIL